jgi:2-C-methyl-D-erythritol 4-phosphate cytidylyltransferase
VIDGVGDRNGEASADHEVESLGWVAFVEEYVASDERPFMPARSECSKQLGGRIGEEVGRREEVLMSHASSTVLPSVLVTLFQPENVWTIVVGGGSGARFGRPKQYERLDDTRMIDHSVAVSSGAGVGVVVVVPLDDVERESVIFAGRAIVVAGGPTRSASVRCGLAAVPEDSDVVVVHDAARPFASRALFAAVIEAVGDGADGAVPGLAVTDTIKVVGDDGVVTATPPRERLVAVQTPQAFRAEVLRAAHRAGAEGTDDAAVVEAMGGRVVVVPGEPDNRKVTHPIDLDWARAHLGAVVVAGEGD